MFAAMTATITPDGIDIGEPFHGYGNIILGSPSRTDANGPLTTSLQNVLEQMK